MSATTDQIDAIARDLSPEAATAAINSLLRNVSDVLQMVEHPAVPQLGTALCVAGLINARLAEKIHADIDDPKVRAEAQTALHLIQSEVRR